MLLANTIWVDQESTMNREKHTWNSLVVSCWIAIMLGACLVYAVGMIHEGLWFDETYSVAMADHSFSQILALTAADNHPPLYYVLLRIVCAMLGSSDWALRILSVAGAVALVSLGAGPVRRIFGNPTAYTYATVTLFTPGILIYAHEARMYSLAILTVTASALYGYLAAQHNRTGDWVRFGLSSLAAAYLHYYALMAVFYLHVVIFFWLLIKRRAHLQAYVFTGGIVLAGYLPWVGVFIRQINDTVTAFWIPPVTPRAVMASFHTPFAYKYLYPSVTPLMSASVFLSLGVILSGLIIAKRKKLERELTFSLFVLVVVICAVNAPLLLSRFLSPVFYPRYTIVYTGLLVLLLSVSITSLPSKILKLTAIGIFALLNILTLKDVYTQYFNDPVRDIFYDLQGAIQPGDLIITSDAFSMGPMQYYFPDALHYFSINAIEAQWEHIFVPFADRVDMDSRLDDLLSTHRSFWYVTNNSGFSTLVWTLLKDNDNWDESYGPKHYSKPFAIRSFTVSKFTYTGQEDEQLINQETQER
jgi:4-amino-4-deoxy-L-arabinose transferase-like glycosyltransferase